MPISDVTRNRHLESDGQEIRVICMIFFHIFLAAFLIHMAYVSRSQNMCICTEIRNMSNYLL